MLSRVKRIIKKYFKLAKMVCSTRPEKRTASPKKRTVVDCIAMAWKWTDIEEYHWKLNNIVIYKKINYIFNYSKYGLFYQAGKNGLYCPKKGLLSTVSPGLANKHTSKNTTQSWATKSLLIFKQNHKWSKWKGKKTVNQEYVPFPSSL